MTEEKVTDVAAESNGKEEKAENEANTVTVDEADLESAVIRQVEYYFGDLNLSRDKFLREQVKLDDGWVPFEILIKFNRLAKLTTDLELIAKMLGKSTSGLLEVSEDNKKVRRSPEMPVPEMNEERRKEIQGRTVYAKGFPKDLLLDDILKYFKQFEVENVIMRKYQDNKTKKRQFKGSVFATFKTKEQAEKFLEQADLKYDETELFRKWQEAYLAEKQEEYAAKKEKKDKKPKNAEQEAPQDDFKLPTGTVLHLAHGNDKLKREDIKEGLTKFGGDYEIAYVDSNLGDTEAWVRFAKEDAAKELFEKITDGKVTIADTEITVKLLEGEEETTYLTKTIEQIRKRRFHNKNNKHHNKGRRDFKGKHQHGRKRRQDNHEEAPAAKVKADS